MFKRFFFDGDERLASYVTTQLEDAGLTKVDDVKVADAILTYHPYSGALENAYFDETGIVKHATKGAVLIDLSPSTPAFARELSAVATVSDLHFVEAPLAVSELFATDPFTSPDGLLCFAAGEDADVANARPVLDALSSSVSAVGGAGAGQLAKARKTIAQAAELVAEIESGELYRATLRSALSSEGALPASLNGNDYSSGVSVSLFMSDVVAAISAADDVDLILPHLEAALHMLELMAVIGGADRGISSLVLLYRSEEEGAENGLDWSRAEGLFESGFANGNGDDEFDDYGDYGDYGDNLDFPGGFGGYSSN